MTYEQELLNLLNEVAEGSVSPIEAYDDIMNKINAVTESPNFQVEVDEAEANSDSMANEWTRKT